MNKSAGSYDPSPTDTHFFPSAGLSDANATYLAAVIIMLGMNWIVWINFINPTPLIPPLHERSPLTIFQAATASDMRPTLLLEIASEHRYWYIPVLR